MIVDTEQAAELIHRSREATSPQRSLLVGLSGIDGSGKGFLSKQLVDILQARRIKAVHLNVDGWLNLPHVRFSDRDPGRHFYLNAIRFDQMFQQLILPLKQMRRIFLEADFAEETATEFRRHLYQFEDVDVILLEGIYLFKYAYRSHFDLKIWIECSFETALDRALARRQEGLSAAETIRAYETIYFPAQRIHFEKDRPQAAADAVLLNDPRKQNYTILQDVHQKLPLR